MNNKTYENLTDYDTKDMKIYIQPKKINPCIKNIIIIGGLLTALTAPSFTSPDIDISEDNMSMYTQFSESSAQNYNFTYLSCFPEIKTNINDDAPLELSISNKIKVKIGKIEPLEFSAIEDEKGFI